MLTLNDPEQLVVREVIATFWIALDLCLIFIFGAYLFRRALTPRWRSLPEVRAAIGLTVYFIGIEMTRVWGWLYLRQQLFDTNPAIVQTLYVVSVAGNAVALWGAVCMVRAFADDKRMWWITLLAAIGFVILTHAVEGAMSETWWPF